MTDTDEKIKQAKLEKKFPDLKPAEPTHGKWAWRGVSEENKSMGYDPTYNPYRESLVNKGYF